MKNNFKYELNHEEAKDLAAFLWLDITIPHSLRKEGWKPEARAFKRLSKRWGKLKGALDSYEQIKRKSEK